MNLGRSINVTPENLWELHDGIQSKDKSLDIVVKTKMYLEIRLPSNGVVRGVVDLPANEDLEFFLSLYGSDESSLREQVKELTNQPGYLSIDIKNFDDGSKPVYPISGDFTPNYRFPFSKTRPPQ